jgi:hypothetical protein
MTEQVNLVDRPVEPECDPKFCKTRNEAITAFFNKSTNSLNETFQTLSNPEFSADERECRRKAAKEKYDHVINQFLDAINAIQRAQCIKDCDCLASAISSISSTSSSTLNVAFSFVLNSSIPCFVEVENGTTAWVKARMNNECDLSELQRLLDNIDCELQLVLDSIIVSLCGKSCVSNKKHPYYSSSSSSHSTSLCKKKPCKKPIKKGYDVYVDLKDNRCGRCHRYKNDDKEKGLRSRVIDKKNKHFLDSDTSTESVDKPFICSACKKRQAEEKRRLEDNQIEDKQTEDEQVEDKQTEDNQIEDKQTEDNQIEDKQTEDEQVEDKQTEDEQVEDKQTENSTHPWWENDNHKLQTVEETEEEETSTKSPTVTPWWEKVIQKKEIGKSKSHDDKPKSHDDKPKSHDDKPKSQNNKSKSQNDKPTSDNLHFFKNLVPSSGDSSSSSSESFTNNEPEEVPKKEVPKKEVPKKEVPKKQSFDSFFELKTNEDKPKSAKIRRHKRGKNPAWSFSRNDIFW